MAMHRWGVLQVRETEPEQFIIVGLDIDVPNGKPFMQWSELLSEGELRKRLASRGVSVTRIEESIQKARENPL